MREVKTNKGTLLVKESVKEISIGRYTDFTKYVIQDVGIGSDIPSIDDHYRKIDTFLVNGRLAEARAERLNLHFCLILAINKINITHLCFALFIHKINGEQQDDYSEAGLIRICKLLDQVDLGRGDLETILSEIKKKLLPS